ncbi:diguanylate cyclase [Mariprofundus sp. NF]|nr:diguanylate cyclase [Mariprofundus sp. NF]
MLEMLLEEDLVEVIAVVDRNADAPGLALAREHGITVFSDLEEALKNSVPCVVFNMTNNEMVEAVASEILGAGGVIGGMEAKLILRIINNMKKAKAELHFQASHDLLTGLYNRRYMMDQLHQGVSQAIRYQHSYAVAMIDLDHFKQVNDLHGHAAGDLVLSHMARVLRECVRESDVPGRWGGEEFIVLLPHTTLRGAKKAADTWLNHLNESPVRLESGEIVTVGFSAGIAMLEGNEKADVNTLVNRLLHVADGRMYRAKDQGRNRVMIEGDIPDAVHSEGS